MGEPYVTHSRRRCRLVSMQGAAPNPVPDPSLWIVHYGTADKADRIPTNTIPVTPPVQQSIAARQQLLSMGQIVRKEFVLSDRVNWPQIPFPGRGNPMYAPPANARSLPQTMAYPPQGHPGVGPTPKRRGVPQVPQGQAGQPPMIGGMQPPEFAFDDDEDTTKGDMFDHLTPRDVSIARYQQNHEWMEEVLSSPYSIGQIVLPDLGMGLKGELASLTEGIFEAPGSNAAKQLPKKPYVGRLDPGLADEFRKRVNEKVDTTNAEIEKMKADHEKSMARFRRNGLVVKHAEEELRTVREPGWEMWRLEGEQQEDRDEGASTGSFNQHRTVDDILRGVEKAMGRHASVVSQVQRVQAGGYQESVPEPEPAPVPPVAMQSHDGNAGTAMSRHPSQAGSQHSGIMIGDSDMDGGGTAAGLLDQMHTGFSSTSTPNNGFPTPQPQLSAAQSNAGTPVNLSAPSPHPVPTGQSVAQGGAGAEDVDMEDADAPRQASHTTPDQGTGSGEWVVVPKENTSHGPTANSATGASSVVAQQQPSAVSPPAATDSRQLQQQSATATSKPASAAPTPGFDNNDFSSLGDLDTAGEALAGYDPPSIDATGGHLGDDGLDLNMDMEDSAFGEAFHGVGADPNSTANTPADGGM